ncbi:MAG TPA: hypothetical protein VGP93_12195 [Polyangiaceae bacterium]|nr:hypothetical protein [Polyangiaceae bacterium]
MKPPALLGLLALACGGEPITRELAEPLRANGAQFREGTLPGSAPLNGDDIAAGVGPRAPYVTGFDLVGKTLTAGEVDRSASGRTSVDGVAVGLRLADAGSGYWLLPVGGADALNNDEPTWSMKLSFGRDLVGPHTLLAAAFDEQGRSGTQSSVDLCFLPEVPDNGNACDSATPPPAFVVSLHWDSEVDLDLEVITPNGKLVDSRHPSTALEDADGKVDPNVPGTGLIDIDSNRDCVADGKRRENLVFQEKPALGTYLVYANLFDACSEDSVRFQVSFHSAVDGADPGTYGVAETYQQAGELAALQANAGKGIGLFVTQFTVQ